MLWAKKTDSQLSNCNPYWDSEGTEFFKQGFFMKNSLQISFDDFETVDVSSNGRSDWERVCHFVNNKDSREFQMFYGMKNNNGYVTLQQGDNTLFTTRRYGNHFVKDLLNKKKFNNVQFNLTNPNGLGLFVNWERIGESNTVDIGLEDCFCNNTTLSLTTP